MADEAAFEKAYGNLAQYTDNFGDVSEPNLVRVLTDHPEALAPLRMILGLTHNELAWAMKIASEGTTTSGQTLKKFERSPKPERSTARRTAMIAAISKTATAVMERSILQVPVAARRFFHSKLDKRDTSDGWRTVLSPHKVFRIRHFSTSATSAAFGARCRMHTRK